MIHKWWSDLGDIWRAESNGRHRLADKKSFFHCAHRTLSACELVDSNGVLTETLTASIWAAISIRGNFGLRSNAAECRRCTRMENQIEKPSNEEDYSPAPYCKWLNLSLKKVPLIIDRKSTEKAVYRTCSKIDLYISGAGLGGSRNIDRTSSTLREHFERANLSTQHMRTSRVHIVVNFIYDISLTQANCSIKQEARRALLLASFAVWMEQFG